MSFLAAVLLAAPLAAANSSSAGVGARWLNIVDDPRSAGMGSAGTALARGAGSLGANPAGLAAPGQDLEASYLAWDDDIRLQRLAYSRPFGTAGGLGLRLDYVDLGQVETFSLVGGLPQPGETLHPSAGGLGLGLALPVGLGLSAGAEARGLFEDLGAGGGLSAAVDLGLRWAPAPEGLALGLSVLNLGSGPLGARLPLNASLGAAWTQPLRPGADLRAAADLAFSPEADEAASLRVGGEYAVAGVGEFRAGYVLAPANSPSGPSAGLSLGLGRWVSADYAFSALGGQAANQLGLRAQWGGAVTAAPVAIAPAPTPQPIASPTPPPLAQQVATTIDKLISAVDAKDMAASQALSQEMIVQAPALRDRLSAAVKEDGVAPSVFQGDFERAEAYLRTMTRLRRDDAYAWMALGTVLWFEGREPEALDAYQRSYLLDPSQAFVRTRIEQLGGTVPAP